MGVEKAQRHRDRIREKPLPDRLPADWEKLLFTYNLSRERSPFVHASLAKEGHCDSDKVRHTPQEELEQIHGSGHFQDRQLLLAVAHSFLTTRTDPDVVLGVLKDIRKQHFIQHRKRSGKLTGRALRRERNRLAELAQHALSTLQRDFLIGDEPAGLTVSIDAVLEGLRHPAFTVRDEFKLSKGAPAQPWIKKAEMDLQNAGVTAGVKGFRQKLQEAKVKATPRNLPAAFLMALGVIPYRTK
jgi:hypothetical protein